MRITVLFQALILVLVASVIFSSCKSKKKLTSVSDTAQVSEEIKSEIEDSKSEETSNDKPEATTAVKLENYFDAIASAPTIGSANNSIREATNMFSSGDAPVLVIFYAAGGKEEYDEPTTIIKYLNYLKDQKKSPNRVEDYTLDSNGKIKELVLFKK